MSEEEERAARLRRRLSELMARKREIDRAIGKLVEKIRILEKKK